MIKESKRLIKNSGLNIAGNAFNKICRYFIVFLAVRVLGVTDYGYYILAMTIVSIGTIFSNMGLNYGVLRFVPFYRGMRDIEKVKGAILFCGKLLLISTVIISVIVYFSSRYLSNTIFNKPNLDPFIKVLVFTLPFIIISMFSSNVFKGFNVIKYKVLTEDIFVVILRLILFGSCLLLGFSTLGILYSNLISVIAGSVLGLYFVLRVFPQIYRKSIKAICNKKEIISYSFPLFLSRFLSVLLNRTDILMLAYYLPSDQIGIYSISQRIAELVFFISASIFAVFSPTIAESLGKDKRWEIKEYFQKVTRWSLILTVPLFIIIAVFSEELLGIFGKEFTGGKMVLLILSTSFFLNSVFGFSGQVLAVMGRGKIIFINSFFAGIVNIVLNLILIPKYGIIGAALATGFSIFAVNVARTLEVYYLEKLTALKLNLLRPLAIGIISGGVTVYVKNLLHYQFDFLFKVGLIMAFCIIYIALTLMFSNNKEDMMIVRSFLKKLSLLQGT